MNDLGVRPGLRKATIPVTPTETPEDFPAPDEASPGSIAEGPTSLLGFLMDAAAELNSSAPAAVATAASPARARSMAIGAMLPVRP